MEGWEINNQVRAEHERLDRSARRDECLWKEGCLASMRPELYHSSAQHTYPFIFSGRLDNDEHGRIQNQNGSSTCNTDTWSV